MAGDTGLDLHDEAYFRTWFKKWASRTGVNPDPDHRNSKVDYRAAWKAKADPRWDEETKTYSWPDEFRVDQPVKYELEMAISGVRLVPQIAGAET
jgi:hypothetical protein